VARAVGRSAFNRSGRRACRQLFRAWKIQRGGWQFKAVGSKGVVAVRESGALADAGKLLADAPGGVRAIIDIRDDPCHKGQDCRCSSSDKCDRRALACRLIELVGDQKADTEADRGLRKGNNARHREVVAKFIE